MREPALDTLEGGFAFRPIAHAETTGACEVDEDSRADASNVAPDVIPPQPKFRNSRAESLKRTITLLSRVRQHPVAMTIGF